MKKSFLALILAIATLFGSALSVSADDSLIWSNKYPEAHKSKHYDPKSETRTEAEILASIKKQGITVPATPVGDYTERSLAELDTALQMISPKMRKTINDWLSTKGKGPVSFKWTINYDQYPVSKPTLENPSIDLFYTPTDATVFLPTHSASGCIVRAYGYLFYEMLCDKYGRQETFNKLHKIYKDALGEDCSIDTLTYQLSASFSVLLCYAHKSILSEDGGYYPHQVIAMSRAWQGYVGYEFAKFAYAEMLELFPDSKDYITKCGDIGLTAIEDEGVFNTNISPYDDYSAYPHRNKKIYTRENINRK